MRPKTDGRPLRKPAGHNLPRGAAADDRDVRQRVGEPPNQFFGLFRVRPADECGEENRASLPGTDPLIRPEPRVELR